MFLKLNGLSVSSASVERSFSCFWANSLNVDEVVPWEVKNLCNLMNAIFLEGVYYGGYSQPKSLSMEYYGSNLLKLFVS